MRSLGRGCWSLAALLVALGCGAGDGGATQVLGDTRPGREGGVGEPSEIFIDASLSLPGNADGGISGQVGGGSLEDAACASETQRAQQVPLDLYIALDSSGSMSDVVTAGGTVTKWQAVSDALVSFVRDPGSAGLGVGLQYFPLTRPGVPAGCATDAMCNGRGPCDLPRTCIDSNVIVGCATRADCGGGDCVLFGQCTRSGEFCAPVGLACNGNAGLCSPIPGNCRGRDICEPEPYAVPAVDIAPLPGVAPAIVQSLTMHAPDGLTPTSSALAGALQHAKTVAAGTPDRRVVVVLATDGTPTECAPTDIPSISALAAAAASAAPAISTFVIGVFAPEEALVARANLDAIASSGGSSRAFIVETNQNVSQAFLAALNTIRTTALACDYTIPKPQNGVLDYQSVNVRFTPTGGKPATLGYVGSAAGCAQAGGWYYDQPIGGRVLPTKIEICPTTCTGLKADKGGQVNVLLGCKTETIIR